MKAHRIRCTLVATLSVGAVAAILVGVAPAPSQIGTIKSEIFKLLASDGAVGDRFGFSVALNGDTAVIGANRDDGNVPNSGSAYVFVRDGAGVWTQQDKLTADDGAEGDDFGLACALSGVTAVVGAWKHGDNGAAYVFVRDGAGVWTQQYKLTADDGAAGDDFGFSVAISGETIVVGARIHGDNGSRSGAAYVFVRDALGDWTQQEKLLSSNGAMNDLFGTACSFSGETALVGAVGADGNMADSGAAYVFVRDGAGVWTQQEKLFADDGATGDNFGFSVALSGDSAVVGAKDDDGIAGINFGSAYVFVRNGAGVWTQQDKFTADDGADSDQFGASVAIIGDTVVVGSEKGDGIVPNSGSAFVFVRDAASDWTLQSKLHASDGSGGNNFFPVALSGDTAVVGAFGGDDDNGVETGSAYVFDIFNPPGAFSLLTPIDMTPALTTLTPTLMWSQASGLALSYTVRIATDANLTQIVLEQAGLTQTSFDVPAGVLEHGALFHWGVVATNPASDTASTPTSFSFTTAPLLGDLNGDGVVNAADLATLLANWGPCAPAPTPCPADISGTGDGVVNAGDLAQLLANWDVLP